MLTPTNHEDYFMWLEAAKDARRAAKREHDIETTLRYHLYNLQKALRDDFELSDDDITQRIREAL